MDIIQPHRVQPRSAKQDKAVPPICKTVFRPVAFQNSVELDAFFGQTTIQKRKLQLHTKDEGGQWWFDAIEQDENRSLLKKSSRGVPRTGSNAISPSLSTPASSTAESPDPWKTHFLTAPQTPRRRASSVQLSSMGLVKPLEVATPSRLGFMAPNGWPSLFGEVDKGASSRRASASNCEGQHKTTTAQTRRHRLERSNSVGKEVADHFPAHLVQQVVPAEVTTTVEDSIRLPSFLPLPHRLATTKDLDEAFQTTPTSRPSQEVIQASPSTAAATPIRTRPRPARLDLSIPVSPSVAGETPILEQMSRAESTSRKRTRRPWSAHEMSANSLKSWTSMRPSLSSGSGPRNTTSGEARVASRRSSILLSPSSWSPVQSFLRRRTEGLDPFERPPPTPSSSGSPLDGISRSATSLTTPATRTSYRYSLPDSPLATQQAEDSTKAETLLGANPTNRHLLAPGGLPTGEAVYHGIEIPCASIHLASDDEESSSSDDGRISKVRAWLRRKRTTTFRRGGGGGELAVSRDVL